MSKFEPNGGIDTSERARRYSRAKIIYFIVGVIFSWTANSFFVLSGASNRIARESRTRAGSRWFGESLTLTIFMLLSWTASLPLGYLRGYRLEHQYDLSNETPGSWLGDQLKGLALQIALLVPVAQVSLAIIRRRSRDWWAVLSLIAIPFTVIMVHLAPILIAPLFNTYRPLRDQELAERLKELAARSGIKVADVLEMDMSRQTKKANAFFTGIGNTKRIVLADTLLEEFTPEEIETIVAHEIAHQAHRDIWRLIGLGAMTTAVMAYATQRVSEWVLPRAGKRSGITSLGEPEALPLLGLVGSVLGMFLMPAQNAASRYIERQADDFALRLTDSPEAFSSALDRLKDMNLADPDPSRLEQVLLHSHPSIRERIEVCQKYARERDQN